MTPGFKSTYQRCRQISNGSKSAGVLVSGKLYSLFHDPNRPLPEDVLDRFLPDR